MTSGRVETLKELALLGAVSQEVNVSSSELARRLGLSQQSASKRILELMERGLISRSLGAKKQHIRITQKGLGLLRREYEDYMQIFERADTAVIKGEVSTGLGEGQYYLNQARYREQFRKMLGFSPYKGTLNIKLSRSELSKVESLLARLGKEVKGFKASGRMFGAVQCFPCRLRGIDCAVVVPKRSHYTDVIEIISRAHLRRSLGLKDGDGVEVEVEAD